MTKNKKWRNPDFEFANKRYYNIDSEEGKKLLDFWKLYTEKTGNPPKIIDYNDVFNIIDQEEKRKKTKPSYKKKGGNVSPTKNKQNIKYVISNITQYSSGSNSACVIGALQFGIAAYRGNLESLDDIRTQHAKVSKIYEKFNKNMNRFNEGIEISEIINYFKPQLRIINNENTLNNMGCINTQYYYQCQILYHNNLFIEILEYLNLKNTVVVVIWAGYSFGFYCSEDNYIKIYDTHGNQSFDNECPIKELNPRNNIAGTYFVEIRNDLQLATEFLKYICRSQIYISEESKNNYAANTVDISIFIPKKISPKDDTNISSPSHIPSPSHVPYVPSPSHIPHVPSPSHVPHVPSPSHVPSQLYTIDLTPPINPTDVSRTLSSTPKNCFDCITKPFKTPKKKNKKAPTSPKSTSPKSTSPKSTSPKSTSPKSTSPKSTSPKSTSPKSTFPTSPTSPKYIEQKNIPEQIISPINIHRKPKKIKNIPVWNKNSCYIHTLFWALFHKHVNNPIIKVIINKTKSGHYDQRITQFIDTFIMNEFNLQSLVDFREYLQETDIDEKEKEKRRKERLKEGKQNDYKSRHDIIWTSEVGDPKDLFSILFSNLFGISTFNINCHEDKLKYDNTTNTKAAIRNYMSHIQNENIYNKLFAALDNYRDKNNRYFYRECNLIYDLLCDIIKEESSQIGRNNPKLEDSYKIIFIDRADPFTQQKTFMNVSLYKTLGNYVLYSIVCHVGLSIKGGHYICYYYDDDGMLYLMDDLSNQPKMIENLNVRNTHYSENYRNEWDFIQKNCVCLVYFFEKNVAYNAESVKRRKTPKKSQRKNIKYKVL